MDGKRLLLIGPGNLGGLVLDHFLRLPGKHTVGVVGRDADRLQRRTNLAALVANQLGHTPDVSTLPPVDLCNIDQTADTIAKFRPDIIFSAVSLQSWWVISTLPKPIFERLDHAHTGPWLPMHLTLVYRLMQAVKQANHDVLVINASYPDVVHPVLAKVGLSPTIGIGNVSNNIPGLRYSVACKLGEPVEDVEVRFIAQHYVSHRISRAGDAGGAPFHLSASVRGRDRSHDLDLDTIFDHLPTRFRRVGGVAGQAMTAASAITVLAAVANDTGRLAHAPGPNGLPGGYPVWVDGTGGKPDLPEGITLDDAVAINTGGQVFEGIEEIHDDGSVTFAEREMSILAEMLGYDCRHMTLDETAERAAELGAKYTALARQYQ
jgi:hypothetical protein